MLQFTVKQTRSNLSTLLRRAERGESLSITRRGRTVARISPVRRADNKLPCLREFRASLKIKGGSMSQTIRDLRDEERF